MNSPAVIKRPPLAHRPWITAKYYDDYTRKSILHCDAWVMSVGPLKYLAIDWMEAGKTRVAQDAWLIEPDGLTPIWDTWRAFRGVPVLWCAANHHEMSRIHQRVLAQAREAGRAMRSTGTDTAEPVWSRVVVQAHYVAATDKDFEPGAGEYTERKAYAPRRQAPLPDIL